VISPALIAMVARQHDIPIWLAQAITANVALGERLRAERQRFPRRAVRMRRLALLDQLDKENTI
jgi:hypothetical protein